MKYYILCRINENWAVLSSGLNISNATTVILFQIPLYGLRKCFILVRGKNSNNSFIVYRVDPILRINNKIDYQTAKQIGFNTFKECNEQCHLTETNLNKAIRKRVRINHRNQFRVIVKPISYTKLKQILIQAKDEYSDEIPLIKSDTASKLTTKKVALRDKQLYKNGRRIYK